MRPELPAHLSNLMERKERFTELPNDVKAVKDFIAGQMARKGAA